MEKIRIRFHFTGNVQGVCFRYRASHAASRYHLTGWVRNNWDDSVDLELQGDRSSIGRVVETLYSAPFICIGQVEQEELPLLDESSFQIRG